MDEPLREPHKDDLPSADELAAAERAAKHGRVPGARIHTHLGQPELAVVEDENGRLGIVLSVRAIGAIPPGCYVGMEISLEHAREFITAMTRAIAAVEHGA